MARLHVHEYGSPAGAPVLALHGVRGNGARFHRLGEAGIGEMRVLAPDLRGHGRSTWDPPWDAERHVEDLLETLDALGIARTAVIAHSFGGLLAMRLAAAAPERVDRLALIDPAVALDPEEAAAYAEEDLAGEGRAARFPDEAAAREHWLQIRPEEGRWALEHEIATHLEHVPAASEVPGKEGHGGPEDLAPGGRPAEWPGKEGHGGPEDLAPGGRPAEWHGTEGGVRWRFSRRAAICAWSEMARPAPGLGAFAGPIMLIVAMRQSFVTPALERRLRDEAGGRLERVTVPSGHVPMWDAPDDLAAVLDAFLARTPA